MVGLVAYWFRPGRLECLRRHSAGAGLLSAAPARSAVSQHHPSSFRCVHSRLLHHTPNGSGHLLLARVSAGGNDQIVHRGCVLGDSFLLFGVVPNVLAMRSPEELEREINARKSAEGKLQTANADLERRVSERTALLAAQDDQLRVTVAALQQSEQLLLEADKRKDEFLATLAHELRNPLAPIRNSLEVMRRAGNDSAVLEQSRGTMERQMSQMVRLVDDLLDVSRISRNRLTLRRERAELPQYDRSIHALVADLHERGLEQDVAVVVWGEMGRTPRVGTQSGTVAGRDHWPQAGFALFAGGGLRMGQVIGATDHRGELPASDPHTPQNLLATLY